MGVPGARLDVFAVHNADNDQLILLDPVKTGLGIVDGVHLVCMKNGARYTGVATAVRVRLILRMASGSLTEIDTSQQGVKVLRLVDAAK